MSITRLESKFYKKNGYLVKDQLISKKDIDKLNVLINKNVTKEKKSRKKVKDQGGTQSYDNYHFVFNSKWSLSRFKINLKNFEAHKNKFSVVYQCVDKKKINFNYT